jgi:hypothetical protein
MTTSINDKQSNRPKYNIGEIVKVKSRDDIYKSLDAFNRLDGCLFTEQMWRYCNLSYHIIKVVSNIFIERDKRTHKTTAPFYVLRNIICEGRKDCFSKKCDHSCMLLWHERWLDKVN